MSCFRCQSVQMPLVHTGPTYQLRGNFAPLSYHVKLNFVAALVVEAVFQWPLLSVTWSSHVKHFWHAGRAKSSMIMAAQFKAERLIECASLVLFVEWFIMARFFGLISFRWVQNSCDHLPVTSPIAWMAEMGERQEGNAQLRVLAYMDSAWDLGELSMDTSGYEREVPRTALKGEATNNTSSIPLQQSVGPWTTTLAIDHRNRRGQHFIISCPMFKGCQSFGETMDTAHGEYQRCYRHCMEKSLGNHQQNFLFRETSTA